ncbi:MAG: hypothetical protein J0H62_00575 [Rhizobiales bacterium]|nr:hypothetical protein [Hyphomicrobiales bacterium]
MRRIAAAIKRAIGRLHPWRVKARNKIGTKRVCEQPAKRIVVVDCGKAAGAVTYQGRGAGPVSRVRVIEVLGKVFGKVFGKSGGERWLAA